MVDQLPLTKYRGLFYPEIVKGSLDPVATLIAGISIYHKLWSAISGQKMSRSDFMKAGERIHILELYMNTREGMTVKTTRCRDACSWKTVKNDPKGRFVPLTKMLKNDYRIRSYDENGIPKADLMKKLSIDVR